jgi:STE24 endopeptidase
MSEMTATRIGRLATITVLAALWLAAALLLWQTSVPDDLSLPHVRAADVFSRAELGRIEDYRSVSRWLWAGGVAAELAMLVVLTAVSSRLARLRVAVAALVTAVLAQLAATPLDALAWRRRVRFGLSEQGFWGWLGDEARAIAFLSALVVLAAVVAAMLARRFGRRWWLPGWALLAGLAFVFVAVQPVVIQPLFTKTRPLADAALAARIERIGARIGVHVGKVEVAEASVRTTAGNAAVFGLGPTRRVALDDTVLDGRFTRPQIEVLAAHELGHVAKHHVWRWTALFALFALPGLAVVAATADTRGGPTRPEAVPVALLAALVFSLAALPLANAFSRRYETEADWVALRATREPSAMIGLQRGLALSGLVDPTPPTWSRLLLTTHPSPLRRIALAQAFEKAG